MASNVTGTYAVVQQAMRRLPSPAMAHPGHHATARPNATALTIAETGATLSWAELHTQAVGWANHLHDLGLRPGDAIAMCLENRFEFVSVLWACQYAGFRYTPISTRLTPSEVGYIVDNCEARACFVSTRTEGSVTDLPSDASAIALINVDVDTPTTSEPPRYERSEGWPMMYSSGSTGQPKGVRRPAPPEPVETLPPGTAGSGKAFGLDDDSVYLSTAPLYHSAPIDFLITMNRLGAATVIMERFDAASALAAIETYRVTHSQWVPIMFIRMLGLADDERLRHDLSSHRWAIHGAGPCTVATKEAMLDWWGLIIHEYYAGTEGSGLCMIGPEDWLTHKGSVGRSVRGPVRILDNEGAELATGEIGQIWFGNSSEFEYHGDTAKTAEARKTDGTGSFGDIGFVDADGFVYLTDRKAFTINVGGINVYPRETEEILLSHPAVHDVAVFGIPNAEYGEEVKAVVQAGDGYSPGLDLAAELTEHCRTRLASFKVPRSIDFVDEFPREPTGKVRIGELRKAHGALAGPTHD